VKTFILLSSALLGLALAYIVFQAVRYGPEPCGGLPMPRGADEVATDWMWIPPRMECVYFRRDENENPHEVARRPAR
jgi:hypothetical protein